jgi:nitroreductase
VDDLDLGVHVVHLVLQERLDQKTIADDRVDVHFLGTVIDGSDFRHERDIPCVARRPPAAARLRMPTREDAMEFRQVIETTGTCRFYRPDPIPDDVLARVLDGARFAPTGGNRQGVRFIVVRDAAKRRQLKNWYLPIWEQYVSRATSQPGAPRPKLLENADHFARHLDEVPALVVVCANLADILATDRHLDRLSIVGGASVYPSVQNLLLAARAEGLGTALTTLLCAVEPQVKTLFGIPDGVATAAMIALGYPARAFPKKLARRPLSEIGFADSWGVPLFA